MCPVGSSSLASLPGQGKFSRLQNLEGRKEGKREGRGCCTKQASLSTASVPSKRIRNGLEATDFHGALWVIFSGDGRVSVVSPPRAESRLPAACLPNCSAKREHLAPPIVGRQLRSLGSPDSRSPQAQAAPVGVTQALPVRPSAASPTGPSHESGHTCLCDAIHPLAAAHRGASCPRSPLLNELFARLGAWRGRPGRPLSPKIGREGWADSDTTAIDLSPYLHRQP